MDNGYVKVHMNDFNWKTPNFSPFFNVLASHKADKMMGNWKARGPKRQELHYHIGSLKRHFFMLSTSFPTINFLHCSTLYFCAIFRIAFLKAAIVHELAYPKEVHWVVYGIEQKLLAY